MEVTPVDQIQPDGEEAEVTEATETEIRTDIQTQPDREEAGATEETNTEGREPPIHTVLDLAAPAKL